MNVLPLRSFKLFTFPSSCRHSLSYKSPFTTSFQSLGGTHSSGSCSDTMTKLACAQFEHMYAHRRNLMYHLKSKHPDVSVERKVRGAGKKVKTGLGFKCDQCGYLFTECRSLERHVTRNHTDNPAFNCDQFGRSYSKSGNLEMHKRTCTGPIVAPAPKRRHTAFAIPEFTVRRKQRHLVVHQRCMKWI